MIGRAGWREGIRHLRKLVFRELVLTEGSSTLFKFFPSVEAPQTSCVLFHPLQFSPVLSGKYDGHKPIILLLFKYILM